MQAINVSKLIDESEFGCFHWRLLVLSLATTTFDGYDLVLYGAAVPLLMKEWSLDAAYAGRIGGYALLGAAVGALVFGRWADKVGRKTILIACVALFSAASGLAGFAAGPFEFGVCRFVAGLGIGGSLPNIIALTAEYAPARHRALAVAATSAGMQLGGIAAAGASMWLFPLYGWRSVFFVGAMPLVLLPLLVKFMPESPLFYVSRGRSDRLEKILKWIRPGLSVEEQPQFQIDRHSGRAPVSALFQEHRGFSTVLVWIVYVMNMYMIFGLGIWLPKLMMDSGFPLGSGLWFLLSLNLGAFVGSNLSGLVADRIGSKRTLVALFLLAFVSIALLGFKADIYTVTLLVALAGTGFFGGINVCNGYVPLFYPPAMRSTAMGFALGIGRFGAICGPAVAGILISMHFSPFANFLGLAVPGLIACLAVVLIQDQHGYLFGGVSAGAVGKQARIA